MCYLGMVIGICSNNPMTVFKGFGLFGCQQVMSILSLSTIKCFFKTFMTISPFEESSSKVIGF